MNAAKKFKITLKRKGEESVLADSYSTNRFGRYTFFLDGKVNGMFESSEVLRIKVEGSEPPVSS